MDVTLLITRAAWASIAALGFAILFSVPKRALWAVALLAAIAYAMRDISMFHGLGPTIASLMASCSIGFLGIQLAHWVHTPTTVFIIPSVIPMVPGVFAYRAMMGILAISHAKDISTDLVLQTVGNGINAILILLALAVGVSLPSLVFRNKSVKEIRLLRWKRRS